MKKKRILATLTAFFIFMSVFLGIPQEMMPIIGDFVLDSGIDVSAYEDWKNWTQADSRWGDKNLGYGGRTCKAVGCFVTSITKIAVQAGLINPDEYNVGNGFDKQTV